QKEPHGFIRFFQPLEMSDGLVRFGGEAEAGSSGGDPTVDCVRPRHALEGCIQLDRVEPCGIKLQESLGRQLFRKKRRLPGRIRPARSTDIEHGLTYTANIWRVDRETSASRPARLVQCCAGRRRALKRHKSPGWR